MKKNETGSAKIVLISLACVFGFILFAVLGVYGYVNGLRSTSISYETQLNAQYLANQNYLSAYISGFYEQIGVGNLKSDKLDKILLDAVKGRYEKEGFSSNGALFSAIAEAYPDLSGLNIFDKIVDYIASKREGYRAIQDKLLDMLRSYDAWRQDGFVQSQIVASFLGVPSQRLEARIGDSVLRGSEAREKMWQIVLTQEAKDAYQSGTMAPLSVNPK
ncbi:MAG: hypothetical protein WAV31_05420 [Candidatus Moraniibacteriota bacterium]